MLCVLLYLSTLMPGPHWRVCFTSRSDTILTVLGKSNKNVKLSYSEALPARVGNLHLVSWAGPVPRLLGLQGRRRGHDWAWAEGWRWGDLLLIGGLCKSLQGGWVMERTWVRSWTSCVALDKLLTLSEFPLGGGSENIHTLPPFWEHSISLKIVVLFCFPQLLNSFFRSTSSVIEVSWAEFSNVHLNQNFIWFVRAPDSAGAQGFIMIFISGPKLGIWQRWSELCLLQVCERRVARG